MLKRELKINAKALAIWTSVLLFLFLVIFLVYPTITSSASSEQLKEMLKIFPEEILKMMNFDLVGMESVFGWFQSEGMMFLALIGCLYAGTLGSTILLKEESDKTIEFLYSKPITRNSIVTSKILCGIINIFIMTFVVMVFNLIGFLLSNDIKLSIFLNLSGGLLLIYYAFFFVMLFISTFLKKSKKATTLCFGVVFISFFLQMIGNMSDSISFLKYFSLFELSPTRTIIEDGYLPYLNIAVGIIFIVAMAFGTYKVYNKKELVI